MLRRNQRGQAAVAALVIIVVLIVGGGIIVGGYELGWWLKAQQVNRTAKINRQSYEVQQTYHEKVLSDLRDIAQLDTQIADPSYSGVVAQLRAQRVSAIQTACDHISRLTISGAGIDPDIQAFHDQECVAA